MSHRAALVAGSLALALTGVRPALTGQAPTPAEAWRPFEGTWSAEGRRQVVAMEGGAVAAIVGISGAVVLTSGEGLSRGFRGEAVVFDEGPGVSVGRAVWTDESGDRIFSRLRGEAMQTGKGLVGKVTGGTGRYQGLEGEFWFSWQYVVSSDDGVVQGRAVGLKGRVRRAGASR
jgi:hypothetical protein